MKGGDGGEFERGASSCEGALLGSGWARRGGRVTSALQMGHYAYGGQTPTQNKSKITMAQSYDLPVFLVESATRLPHPGEICACKARPVLCRLSRTRLNKSRTRPGY
jgi:hypothetical protein